MKTVLNILGSALFCVASHAAPQHYTLEVPENRPFSWVENEKFSGMAINVVSMLFEKAKISYTFQSVPLARGMADALAKPNFCAFPVQRAQSNEAEYRWISPIFITTSGLFVSPQSKQQFQVLSDAKPLLIGALRGSGDAQYLKSFGFTVEEVNTQEQNVEKLLKSRIHVWATDVLSAHYFAQKTGTKDQMPKEALTFRRSLGSLACHISMPAADVAKLQNTLDTMIQDGSLEKMTRVER